MPKVIANTQKIDELLTRGVEEVIVKEHLRAALLSGKQLRVKLGIDPTASDLHLGHTIPLRKLRQFQDAGHKAVLIIGDFTARIGDPSGRSEARKPLTTEEVKTNMKKYLNQAGKVIDIKRSEIRYNSEWFFSKEGLSPILEVARSATINQVIQRAESKKRLAEGGSISLIEALYPIMQGYDSVIVEADVEIGGTDQKFNLLMGRQVQKFFNKPEQDIMTLMLLEGTDGERKMSKSYGNYIGIEEKSNEMFGKIMAIPDKLIDKYYALLTDQDRGIPDPLEAKLELGRIIVDMYHGHGEGLEARGAFIKVFSKKEKPEDIKKVRLGVSEINIVELLVKTRLAPSKSEARRLILQGAVKIDDIRKSDPNEETSLQKEILLQVGPRHFLKVKS